MRTIIIIIIISIWHKSISGRKARFSCQAITFIATVDEGGSGFQRTSFEVAFFLGSYKVRAGFLQSPSVRSNIPTTLAQVSATDRTIDLLIDDNRAS